MVLLPLATGVGPHAPPVGAIREMMDADVERIISDAMEQARERPRGEITSGAIVRSTARLWESLRLNNLRVWGASDRE
jgi:hypothetical protein